MSELGRLEARLTRLERDVKTILCDSTLSIGGLGSLLIHEPHGELCAHDSNGTPIKSGDWVYLKHNVFGQQTPDDVALKVFSVAVNHETGWEGIDVKSGKATISLDAKDCILWRRAGGAW